MTQGSKRKVVLMALLLATALLVSSCYMSPSDITDDTDTLNQGSDSSPFGTIGVIVTPTPTPTPTLAPTNAGGVSQPNSWDALFSTPPAAVQTPQNNNNTNVNVTSAPVPTTAPSTRTPTATPKDDGVLRSGAKGDKVSQLQKALKDLGYYTGTVDGEYGTGTANAVKAFQDVNGLKADGVAGEKTLEQVYSYYAVPKPKNYATSTPKPNNNNSGGNKATNTPKPTATPNLSKARYLKVGDNGESTMSGSDVRQLQNRLIALGYLSGTADGSYGGATQAAVIAFQKKAGEWDDGIAGPSTQTKLYASNAPKASSVVASIDLSLKEGMKGPEVRALQKRLIELNYLSGNADGEFGSGTKAAVTAFQQQNGLTADGIAGTSTQNKLFFNGASKNSGTPSSGGTSPTTAPSGNPSNGVYTTLRQGDEGENVKRLQQKLKDLKYYTGNVDGKYGAGTVTAVQSFQTMNGLTVDGVAGPATQQRLYGDSASANKIQGSLKQYDEGTNVRDMQYALYELGYYQDNINGIYGESTFNAVREFQMINELTVDGVAGSATLNLLFSIFAKPVTAPTGDYEILSLGSEGESVALLQATLYDLGYMINPPTGVFDDETYEALKTFQQYNGLPVDGIAGKDSQDKLFSDEAVHNPLRP